MDCYENMLSFREFHDEKEKQREVTQNILDQLNILSISVKTLDKRIKELTGSNPQSSINLRIFGF